jgi:hypothetical protein
MIRTALEDLRRSCIWMSFFAASFVFMYLGVVLLTKFRFTYFQGYLLEADPGMLRAVFYLLAGASVWLGVYMKKKRASRERLAAALKEPSSLLRYLLVTFIFAVALALVPLLSGFFLFFLPPCRPLARPYIHERAAGRVLGGEDRGRAEGLMRIVL